MEQQKVEMFMAINAKKFPLHTLPLIKEHLDKLDDSRYAILMAITYKDPTTLLIISILAGSLGIDRFLLGETGTGIAKLLTCGGFGIWTIIDWFMIQDMTRDANYQEFMKVSMGGYSY
jgi:TM2 domain-containing membrane protein YozV